MTTPLDALAAPADQGVGRNFPPWRPETELLTLVVCVYVDMEVGGGGADRLKGLLPLTTLGRMSTKQEPYLSSSTSPLMDLCSLPLQQTQKKTHMRVGCN